MADEFGGLGLAYDREASLRAEAEGRHPRLFVTAEELPPLRDRLQKEPLASRWPGLLAHAEECLELPCSPPGARLNHSRRALGIAQTTAFAYLVSRERRYGERAKDELDAMLRAVSWENEQWGRFNRGADLVTAERCLAAALVYDWCHDLFTPRERRDSAEAVVRLGLEPYLASVERHDDWWVRNEVTNWCGVVHGGCGLAGLAFSEDSPDAARAGETAWGHLQGFLRHVTRQDGGGHEGVMYWRYGVRFGMYYVAAAARLRGDDEGLFKTYADRLAGYWDVYMHGPDLKYANFNNMGEHTFEGLYGKNPEQLHGGPYAVLCALFESTLPAGDPLLLWAADNGGHFYYGADAYERRGAEPLYFLWRRDLPPAGPKPPLQRNVLFRGAGHVILSSPKLWFVMNGGWTSDRSHHNLDLGTFILVANGERYVNDPGYGIISTSDHSTLVFDGSDQPQDVAGEYILFGEAEGFSCAAVDLSKVNPEKPVRRWVRHAVLVRGAYIVLVDDVELGQPCEVEWRLQSRLPIRAHAAGQRAVVEGDCGVLHLAAASPADAVVSACERHVQGIRGREVDLKTAVIRRAQPESQVVFASVLYPLPIGHEPPVAEMTPDGALTVRDGERRDVIVFEQGEAGWTLQSVNGKSAAGIGRGAERSLRRADGGRTGL